MPSIEELQRFRSRAEAAGDLEAVQRFDEMIAEAQARQPQDLTWGQAISQGVQNLPESTAQFAGDIYQAVRHPVDTLSALGSLVKGGYEMLLPGIPESEDVETAKQFSDFIADRYGSAESIKRTIANDPVGLVADASGAMMGLGGIGTRGGGRVAVVGKKLKDMGKAIDPMTATAKATGKIVDKAGEAAAIGIGHMSGVGKNPVVKAAEGAAQGGETAGAVARSVRGFDDMLDVVNESKQALENMRTQLSDEYKNNIAKTSQDKTVLDFDPIVQAIEDATGSGMFGDEVKNKSTVETRQAVRQAVENWASKDPSFYHTPEGLDAFKQQLWDIGEQLNLKPDSQAMKVLGSVYHAVHGQITKQSPDYAKTMQDYEKGIRLIRDLEKSLSLNDQAMTETTLKKLQSSTRNNVNTGYGRRENLVQMLEDAGATDLSYKLAGQALNSPTPRGLQGAVASIGAGAVMQDPSYLAMLPLTSPRVVGELSMATGMLRGGASRGANKSLSLLKNAGLDPQLTGAGAFQTGRLADLIAKEQAEAERAKTLKELGAR